MAVQYSNNAVQSLAIAHWHLWETFANGSNELTNEINALVWAGQPRQAGVRAGPIDQIPHEIDAHYVCQKVHF